MRITLILILVLLPLAAAETASGAIHVINPYGTGEFPNLYTAVQASVDGDEIWLEEGEYTGDGNTEIDLGGRAIRIWGEYGPGITFLRGQNRQVFRIWDAPAGAIIEGVSISSESDRCGSAAVCGLGAAPTFRNVVFHDSGGQSCTYAEGGAVACVSWASPVFENCVFHHCEMAMGGAVFCEDHAAPVFRDCRIEHCHAGMMGGAIYCAGGSQVTLTRTCISRCSSHMGGAVYFSEADLIAEWTLIESCSAIHAGGGIYLRDGSADLTRITAGGCQAEFGGGISLYNGTYDIAQVIVVSCSGGGIRAFDSEVSITCSDVWANEGGNYTGELTDMTGIDGNISADPIFCTEFFNPGDPWSLSYDSPCSEVNNECGLTMGARDPGCLVDWPEECTVPDEFPDIASAIDYVEPGDTILVLPGVYTGDANTNIDFGGKDIVLMSTGGSAVTVIDCEGEDRGACFSSGETAAAVLQGFTIRHGIATYTSPSGSGGGGVKITACSPTLRDLVIEDCVSSSAHGGGIYCYASGSRLEDVVLRNNGHILADLDGGGLYSYYSDLTLDRALFVDNEATGSGGGMAVVGGQPQLSQVTFFHNQAGVDGGAFWAETSLQATLTGICAVMNTSSSGGAVAASSQVVCVITCSDVFANTPANYGGALPDQTGTGGNISAWPLFCDFEAGDFHLLPDSPCLPANNDCGIQMGAYGEGCQSTAADAAPASPRLMLHGWPNPFNPSTTLSFDLPAAGRASLRVCDISGRRIRILLDAEQPAGRHEIVWDGRDAAGRPVASGIYLARLEAAGATATRRLVLLK